MRLKQGIGVLNSCLIRQYFPNLVNPPKSPRYSPQVRLESAPKKKITCNRFLPNYWVEKPLSYIFIPIKLIEKRESASPYRNFLSNFLQSVLKS